MSDARTRELQHRADAIGERSPLALTRRLMVGEECGRCEGDPKYLRRVQMGRRGGSRTDLSTLTQTVSELGSTPSDPCPDCAGLILQKRIELAAWVGDGAARAVVPVMPDKSHDVIRNERGAIGLMRWSAADTLGFELWARGLSRWGQAVCMRAAVAAGRVVLVASASSYNDECYKAGAHDECTWHSADRALDAAQAWVDCPCDKHYVAYHAAGHHHDGSMALRGGPPQWARVDLRVADQSPTILAAASLLGKGGEQVVRDAIRDALVSWALR